MNLNDPPRSVLPPEQAPPGDGSSAGGLHVDTGSRSQTLQFVTFVVANELFAVPMAPVQEIIRVPVVAQVPLASPALLGLANLRGRILPIVSLRQLFGLPSGEADDATRALIINIGQPLGFVVDRVASVISVESDQIEAASQISSVISTEFLSGVIQRPGAQGETQLLQVLDFERLVQAQLSGLSGRKGGRGESGMAALDGAPPQDTEEQGGSDELRLVSFTVAGQEFAIDIADVQEIVQVPEAIIAVPRSAHHVLGLVSLRQRLLPLVSLRSLFGLAMDTMDEHHRIVVITLPGGAQVGLVTDTVKEVLSVPRSQTDAMPALLAREPQLQEFESICRLEEGQRLISIITTARLLGMGGVRDALSATSASMESNEMSSHASDDTTDDGLDEDSQMVIFRLGAEEFGVPIVSVQEIVRVPETLTHVPRTPAWVEGVINLRGSVLPVIDQRSRFGLPAAERSDRQRIMVYLLRGVRTGFIVDAVTDVLRIAHRHIEPAPRLSNEPTELVTQVAKLDGDRRLVLLIDPEHLLDAGERGAMAELGHTEPA